MTETASLSHRMMIPWQSDFQRLCSSCFLFLALVAASVQAQPDDGSELDFSYDENVVPLVRIIANPEKFNGKPVTFTGYYHLETHLTAVFLDEDSCRNYTTENAVHVGGRFRVDEEGNKYRHCRRLTVKGILEHSRDIYGFRSKSDLFLKDVEFYGWFGD